MTTQPQRMPGHEALIKELQPILTALLECRWTCRQLGQVNAASVQEDVIDAQICRKWSGDEAQAIVAYLGELWEESSGARVTWLDVAPVIRTALAACRPQCTRWVVTETVERVIEANSPEEAIDKATHSPQWEACRRYDFTADEAGIAPETASPQSWADRPEDLRLVRSEWNRLVRKGEHEGVLTDGLPLELHNLRDKTKLAAAAHWLARLLSVRYTVHLEEGARPLTKPLHNIVEALQVRHQLEQTTIHQAGGLVIQWEAQGCTGVVQ